MLLTRWPPWALPASRRQPILDVKAPSRQGRDRADLIVHLADGYQWRLQRGFRPSGDAIPKHINTISHNSAPSEQHLTPGPSGALTSERASELAGHGRIGKHEVWRALQKMEKVGFFEDWCWLDMPKPLAFRWWRWLANIA